MPASVPTLNDSGHILSRKIGTNSGIPRDLTVCLQNRESSPCACASKWKDVTPSEDQIELDIGAEGEGDIVHAIVVAF